jgi:hypothetical protein
VFSFLILLGIGYIFYEEQANASSEDCTLKNVKGAYGATFTGAITGFGPYTAVARLICDGKGGCHAEGTQSINGEILPLVDESATYIVNPDCTGSIAAILVGGARINFNFIIVNRGKEIRSIQTDPGTAITGNLRQQ